MLGRGLGLAAAGRRALCCGVRFIRDDDVGVAGFYAWRRRLAEPAAAGDHTNAEPPRFVRLAATPDPSDELTAHFPGDVRLTLPASALRVLVAALPAPAAGSLRSPAAGAGRALEREGLFVVWVGSMRGPKPPVEGSV